MQWKNSQERFGVVARLFHWVLALLFFGLFGLGLYITDLTYYDSFYKDGFFLHKSFGALFFLLALARIVWVFLDPKPPLVESLHPFEKFAAKATHLVFYAMTIAIPIAGYLISTADGRGVPFFGLFEIPAILPAEDGREEIAGVIHLWLAVTTMALVGLHIAAALKHHFIDHDDTLLKMAGKLKK